jgi:hypothetical protein
MEESKKRGIRFYRMTRAREDYSKEGKTEGEKVKI